MKKLSILVLSAGTALFSAVPVSVDFSQGTVTVSLDTARAYVGEPWTAASVAGVGARWDVPVHVVTGRADVAAALVAAGFVEGVALAPQQRPIATLPQLSVLLLEAFASQH